MDSQATITQSDLEVMLLDKDSEPKPLQLALLEKITDGFSDEREIGRGGFAVVYKGMLEIGAVAVKKLVSTTNMYQKEFLREVECLMKVKHRNVVQFLGYCVETQGNVDSYDGNLIIANTKQRLLVFEYLSKGSLDHHIKDASEGLEWRKRYKIIKGICEGLDYLHQTNIMHLDLKPANILLDEDMMPKITDFGLSRRFQEDQTRVNASNVGGTLGYLAPESSDSKEITPKFDLYSLGVIIIEILTGKKRFRAIEDVLESWSNRLEISEGKAQWETIRVCAEIGRECINSDPAKRPGSMKQIMDRLVATESSQLILADNPRELLEVHQFALCFPFEPNKSIPCSLHLTNNTDEPVAFRLMTKGESWGSLVRLPLCGIVPPKSPCTLIVIAQETQELPQKRSIDLILEGTKLSDEHTQTFERQANDRHFEKAKEKGNVVQEVSLKAVYTPRWETITSSKAFSPKIKIMYFTGELYTECLYSLDANQAKQWIIVGEDKGHVRIWNYHTQRKMDSIKVSEGRVNSVKFIARKQWFVTGTHNGYIHAYSYETKMHKIKSIKVESSSILLLAVHPTRSYLLSSSYRQMKLWDWDKGWDCVQTFEEEHLENISQVAFNPNDTIASASEDHTVKIWSLDSTKSSYTLSGHSNKVNCLDFFTCADQEYLVTGSDDRTGKIWDMQKRMCVYTLDGFMSPVMSVVYQPTVETLLTGSKDGLVYLWSTTDSRISSNNPRLDRIIDIGCGGAVYGLTCLMKGIVIGREGALAIMDIEQSSDDYSENYTAKSGDTTFEVIAGSNSQQSILNVHPLELQFLYGSEMRSTSSLHLTNKTDEDVAFRLIDNNHPPQYVENLPLHGTVPPRSSYTLVVTMDNKRKLEEEEKEERERRLDLEYGVLPFNRKLQEVTEPYLVLESSILGSKNIVPFADESASGVFFGEAKELGHAVHEVSLKAIYTRTVVPQEETTPKAITPRIELLDIGRWYQRTRRLYSLDINEAKQWIITGGSRGHVGIWNYQTQRKVDYLTVSYKDVTCVKFIARQQWLVAATEHCDVHVYSYGSEMKKVMSMHVGYQHECRVLLAVHPTQPYLLTMSGQEIKLWDWDKSWECREITKGHDYGEIYQFAFNFKDIIAFAPKGHTVEVRSIDSRDYSYTFSGHSDTVNCLDFFTCREQEYLVSGSDDRTAKIWDMELKVCVCTLEPFVSPVMSVVYQPNHQILITGLKDGSIYLWSTTHSRICSGSPSLERIVNIGYGGAVRSLACLMGRVVIGKEHAVAIVDVENKIFWDESTHYSEELITTPARLGDITSQVLDWAIHGFYLWFRAKVMLGSSEILDVHPLKLRFHHKPRSLDHNMGMLYLTNKTDEHVAFRVTNKSGETDWNPCCVELPMSGIVPPRSVHRLIVITRPEECKNLGREFYQDQSVVQHGKDFHQNLILQISISGDKIIMLDAYFFDEAKEMGHAVQEVGLKFIYTLTRRRVPIFEPVIVPGMKIKSVVNVPGRLWCLDAHPTEPWVVTGICPEKINIEGYVRIWNCDSKELASTIKVSKETPVWALKCDARQQLIVALTLDDFVHVYDCATTNIKKIGTFGVPGRNMASASIAIHPTKLFVLLTTLKIWEGDKGWECAPAFGSRAIRTIAFHPDDPDTFATGSLDGKVEVWSLDSSEPNYHMSGHFAWVDCLAFSRRGDQQYLISGSSDCTAKVWDLQKRACIHTLEGFMSPVQRVISLPGHPYLVTYSEMGSIHVWSSTDFRLKRTVNFGGDIQNIACYKGSSRIAIGLTSAIIIMDIDDEEEAAASSESIEDPTFASG